MSILKNNHNFTYCKGIKYKIFFASFIFQVCVKNFIINVCSYLGFPLVYICDSLMSQVRLGCNSHFVSAFCLWTYSLIIDSNTNRRCEPEFHQRKLLWWFILSLIHYIITKMGTTTHITRATWPALLIPYFRNC